MIAPIIPLSLFPYLLLSPVGRFPLKPGCDDIRCAVVAIIKKKNIFYPANEYGE
jgi:hypothetical protein